MYNKGVHEIMPDTSKVLLGLLIAVTTLTSWDAGAAAQPNDLWAQATLYRDEWGTPHVYGDTPRAMAFAFGYAQAEDHLEEMLMAYRIANGGAAEVMGESYAESDAFSLKMGHAALARRAYQEADPITRQLCEGFALGVNSWLSEHHEEAPTWAEGVRPQDILALLHAFLMTTAPFDLPDVYHRSPAMPSANAWAVSGAHSVTGEALLAINPHGDYGGPFQWYEAHLVTQDMNVAGATVFGLPILLQGHNEVLGWGLAPNEPDIGDMYIERPPQVAHNPAQVNQPQIDFELLQELQDLAHTVPFTVRTPTGFAERHVQQVHTPRGPVVGTFRGRQVSYKVGGYTDLGGLRQLMEMGRARNLREFQEALAMRQLPSFHVVYADRAGNIFYLYNATVGTKYMGSLSEGETRIIEGSDPGGEEDEDPHFVDWQSPVPSGDTRYRWGPLVPLSALPSLTNPGAGFVQASGTPPWGATNNADIAPSDYPYWFVRDADTARARRVRSLLGRSPRNFHDIQSMLYDVAAPFAMEAVPHLLQAGEAHQNALTRIHPDVPAALNILRDWNYMAEPSSVGMTCFDAWWRALKAIAPPVLHNEKRLRAAVREDSEAMRELSLRAVGEAAKHLRNQHQSLSVPWEYVHRAQRGDKNAPLPGGASGESIFFSDRPTASNSSPRPVQKGYGYAMAVRFGETPEAVSILPFGTSQDPRSPHYDDQFELFTDRRFKRTRFRHDEVQRAAQRAVGRNILLRPQGIEAQFQLRAETPIVASLDVSSEPPAPLPEGLAAFSLFAELETARAEAPFMVNVDVFIPETLADSRHFPYLGIWVCDASGEWRPAELQDNQSEIRTLSAREQGAKTFAVLGPDAFLRRPEVEVESRFGVTPRDPDWDPAEPMEIDPEDHAGPFSLEGGLEDLAPPVAPGEEVSPFTDDEGKEQSEEPGGSHMHIEPAGEAREGVSLTGLRNDGRFRVFEGATQPDEDREDTLTPPRTGSILTPREDSMAEDDPEQVAQLPDEPTDTEPGAQEPPEEAEAFRTPEAGEREPVIEYTPPEDEETAPPQRMQFSRPEDEAMAEQRRQAQAEEQDRQEERDPVIQYTPDGDSSPQEGPRRHFAFTDEEGKEAAARLRAQQEQETSGGQPDEDYKAVGPVQWGRNIQVRAPEMQATFHVQANTAIQARVAIPNQPPSPPPEGLAAFTEYMRLEHHPEGIGVRASISARLPSGVCDEEHMEELRLYYHHPNDGWRPVEDARFNAERETFSALDRPAGLYVVFGPSEYRR
ncbi:MAG: penicillin acylase family protein [Candidatus Hydrogenedentota bacterium]